MALRIGPLYAALCLMPLSKEAETGPGPLWRAGISTGCEFQREATMRKLEGAYRAKRDDQTYAYEVTCWIIGHTALWEATIRLRDQLVGMPCGEVLARGGVGLAGAVKLEVEAAIEYRLVME